MSADRFRRAAIGSMLALGCCCALADDLMEVHRKASERDTVLRAAAYALQMANERVPQARAGLLPALSLVGGTGRQEGRASFGEEPYEDRNARNWNWNLQLTQPLWRAASWAALGVAAQEERLAQEQFRLAEQELALRVTQSYLDVLVAQEAARVAGLQVDAIDQQLALARRNFEVGTATVTDVHEAQSRLDLSRAQAIAARNDLEGRRTELERILGEPVERLASLRDDGRMPAADPNNAQEWVDSARAQSLQVRIAQAAREVAAREVERSRAAHSPSLDLTAGYGTNYGSGSVSSPANIAVRSRSGQIGVSFSMPLYAGGGVQARVREAIAAQGRAEEELEAARRQAAATARQAFAGVVNGRAQIDALDSAIRSSKSSLEANRIGYRIGTRINIDVLNAQQQLYAAQRDWHKARAETLMQGLRLKAANASLDATDLQAINDLLKDDTP
ncbi:MAG: TolC family outer membrane protein [Variovorax sp.]